MSKLTIPPAGFKEYSEKENLIPGGWHSFEATKTDESVSSKGDSMNFWLYTKCLTPGHEGRDVPRKCFNEKSFEPKNAKYEVIPFILALDPSLTVTDLVNTGISIDWPSVVGKRFDAFVNHKEYNGRISEEFKDFAPFGTRAGK